MAKEVMNPNVVPGSEILEGSAPQQAEQVDLEQPVGVVVLRGQPTRQIPVYDSKGRQKGWETVLDKSTQFSQPKGDLLKTAHHACSKGTSGKVLVFAETGVLLARFADNDVAEKHLKACGLSLNKLMGVTQKERGRDIKPVEDKKAAK
jgi:hypothetical protein